MVWIVRLVSIAPEGEDHSTDVMRIARPDTLADLGTLGLSLAEGKLLIGLEAGFIHSSGAAWWNAWRWSAI